MYVARLTGKKSVFAIFQRTSHCHTSIVHEKFFRRYAKYERILRNFLITFVFAMVDYFVKTGYRASWKIHTSETKGRRSLALLDYVFEVQSAIACGDIIGTFAKKNYRLGKWNFEH